MELFAHRDDFGVPASTSTSIVTWALVGLVRHEPHRLVRHRAQLRRGALHAFAAAASQPADRRDEATDPLELRHRELVIGAQNSASSSARFWGASVREGISSTRAGLISCATRHESVDRADRSARATWLRERRSASWAFAIAMAACVAKPSSRR